MDMAGREREGERERPGLDQSHHLFLYRAEAEERGESEREK